MARRTIHIPDEFTDIINHLESQYNMSRYVCDLIRKDMEEQNLKVKKRDEDKILLDRIRILVEQEKRIQELKKQEEAIYQEKIKILKLFCIDEYLN